MDRRSLCLEAIRLSKIPGQKDVMHMMFDMKNNQRARAMEHFLKKLYGTGRAAVQL